MFDGLRLKIGVLYSRYHFRGERDKVIHFTESVSRAKRALVIFPETTIDWESTQTILKQFSRRFAPGAIVIVLREQLASTLPASTGVRTLTYRPEEISRLFVPRETLLRKMKTSTFDAVFDLNIGFSLPSAFLCRASEAPLRVSFEKMYGDEFYNLQIHTKAATNSSAAYKGFLRCLEMF
jgi:hypothetical protein